jgi:flagellar FliL protein
MIELLSSKTYSELATLHGKERLKSEIMIRLNSILKTGSVKNVFFTEFVMQ